MKALPASFLVMCMALTACQKDPTEGMTNPEISEKAMDNFLNKIREGNYTISDGSFLKTSVYSKDLVWFDYTEDIYNDFTVMSVDNEAFQATLKEDGLEEVAYVSEGQAIDAASSRLLNYWLKDEVSEGNIYNLFYREDYVLFFQPSCDRRNCRIKIRIGSIANFYVPIIAKSIIDNIPYVI